MDFELPVTLSAGTYWVGFAAITDEEEDPITIYFNDRLLTGNSTQVYWRNPGDGF